MHVGSLFKALIHNRYVLQFYFVLFILLNIVDFLNLMPGDLDFFKKLLSWLIIGYVFYQVSFTKIFIGERLRSYDFFYILAFSLMTIPKALRHYAELQKINGFEGYIIFRWLLETIYAIPWEVFIYATFSLGLLMSIITSLTLSSNHQPYARSFLGSFQLRDTFFGIITGHIILLGISIFFGIIVFNFFMEWFALSVDALILVIGLLYYAFVYIVNHTASRVGNLLQDIANTGNDFYQNLIAKFSDKKTFFVGVSFLLTLHLLVDVGVFLVPYAVGLENTLYFDTLGAEDHQPFFSLLPTGDGGSRFMVDFLTSGALWTALPLLLSYLLALFGLGSLMVLPFYIFYQNVRQQRVRLPFWFSFSVLVALSHLIVLTLMSGVHSPLSISIPDFDTSIRGVDISTQTILEDSSSDNRYLLVLSLTGVLGGLFFLISRHFPFLVQKSVLLLILVFFLYYLSLFFVSSMANDFQSASSFIQKYEPENQKMIYKNISEIYEDENRFEERMQQLQGRKGITFKIFSTLERDGIDFVKYAQTHQDYVRFSLQNQDTPYYLKVPKLEDQLIFSDTDSYTLAQRQLLKITAENVTFFYRLGEFFPLQKDGEHYFIRTDVINYDSRNEEFYVDKRGEGRMILFGFGEMGARSQLQSFIEYVRLLFSSIFYLFGMIAFAVAYLRYNFFGDS